MACSPSAEGGQHTSMHLTLTLQQQASKSYWDFEAAGSACGGRAEVGRRTQRRHRHSGACALRWGGGCPERLGRPTAISGGLPHTESSSVVKLELTSCFPSR